MNSNELEKYLRNRILIEIKANSLRKQLTEEQIGNIAIHLASDDSLLTEGFFSTVGALLGGGMTETKRFLAKRVVSFLGIPSGHPLSQPVTDFITRLPTKEIYGMYRGNPRMRKKLVSVLSDATVNAFKQEMPNIMALKGGSLGGPITDAMVKVVSTKEFKKSVQKSFKKALMNLPGSDTGDLQSIRQDIEDLKAGVSDIQQSLKKQTSTDTTTAEAPGEMPTATKAKVKKQKAAVDPAVDPTVEPAAVDTAVVDPAVDTAVVDPAAEKPAAEKPAAELTTEEKLKEVQEFVKRFTPGGSLGVYRDPSAEGIKRGWIAWVRVFRKHKDGENKGKVMNWEGINKIYKAFAAATSDDDKIEALYKSKFIKDAGYEAIQANRSGTPESDLESAKGTGDAEKIAGAAAATVADPSVDSTTRQSAKQDLEDAIKDIPQEQEGVPSEEEDEQDTTSVEELSAEAEGKPEPVTEPEVAPKAEVTPEPEAEEVPTGESTPEADAAVEDTEADAADAKADDLKRAADNEPENQELQQQASDARTAADREREEAEAARIAADKEVQRKERLASVSGKRVSEVTLPPKADVVRQGILKDVAKFDPDTNIELYKRGLNEFIKRKMNSIVEQAEKSEKRRQKESRENESADDYIDRKIDELYVDKLNSVSSNITRNESTVGLGGVFNFRGDDGKVVEVVPTASTSADSTPEEPQAKKYSQVNVELYDDKTIVLTDRSKRGRIKRSKLGESLLSEVDPKFRRNGVTVVELPPVPVQNVQKIHGWGTTSPEQKRSLADEIYNLLKQKAESNPEAVKEIDLGFNEETGKPNLVIMNLSTPAASRGKWSGVFDYRTPAVPELTPKSKALYDKLARKYIRKTTDKEEGVVAGTFNMKTAERDFDKGVRTITGKKIKELADEMRVEYTEDELMDNMADVIRRILVKSGALTSEEPKKKPISAAPKMSSEEEEDLDAGFESALAADTDEEGEEIEGLEETFNISEDQLRRLLS